MVFAANLNLFKEYRATGRFLSGPEIGYRLAMKALPKSGRILQQP